MNPGVDVIYDFEYGEIIQASKSKYGPEIKIIQLGTNVLLESVHNDKLYTTILGIEKVQLQEQGAFILF